MLCISVPPLILILIPILLEPDGLVGKWNRPCRTNTCYEWSFVELVSVIQVGGAAQPTRLALSPIPI